MPLAAFAALMWFGPATAALTVGGAASATASLRGLAQPDAAGGGTAVVTRAAATRLVNRPMQATGVGVVTVALPKGRSRQACHIKVNTLSQDDVVGAVQQMRVEGGLTLVETLRLLLAVAQGNATQLDGNPVFRSLDGSKTRIAATLAGGVRTITTRDAS